MHGGVGLRRAGHVHEEVVAVGQRVQAEHEGHVVVEQAGLCGGRIRKAGMSETERRSQMAASKLGPN